MLNGAVLCGHRFINGCLPSKRLTRGEAGGHSALAGAEGDVTIRCGAARREPQALAGVQRGPQRGLDGPDAGVAAARSIVGIVNKHLSRRELYDPLGGQRRWGRGRRSDEGGRGGRAAVGVEGVLAAFGGGNRRAIKLLLYVVWYCCVLRGIARCGVARRVVARRRRRRCAAASADVCARRC